MNKAINKSIAAILLAIICAFMPTSAAEAATEKNQRLVSEETMYVDGYAVTVSVYEDETPVSVMPLATTYEKIRQKNIYCKERFRNSATHLHNKRYVYGKLTRLRFLHKGFI